MGEYMVKVGTFYISNVTPYGVAFDERKEKALILDNHYQSWYLAHTFNGELITLKEYQIKNRKEELWKRYASKYAYAKIEVTKKEYDKIDEFIQSIKNT